MRHILLVNSVSSSLDREKSFLARADLRIVTAASGEEAIKIHREQRVDLIIAELDMPGITGDSLCSMIRNEKNIRNVSFLLICANTASDLERVSRCGANSWVTRPVQQELLMERVGQLLAVSARKGYRVLLQARVIGSKETTPFFCTSRNLSTSGILIETEMPLELGDFINCTFFLPGSRRIIADSEVVRLQKRPDGSHDYGLRFVALADQYREEIETFIRHSVSAG